jgi:hypothetical protein
MRAKIAFLVKFICLLCFFLNACGGRHSTTSAIAPVTPPIPSLTDDIYVLGWDCEGANSEKCYPTVWKNGVATHLTNGDHDDRMASIVVSEGDVYVAGAEKNDGGFYVAKLWKNGEAISLTDGNSNASVEDLV